MSIDVETARRVAKLARIQVDDSDLAALAGELSGILTFMEQLNEVDVTGVEPMTSVTPMRLKRRVDEVTDGGMQAAVAAQVVGPLHAGVASDARGVGPQPVPAEQRQPGLAQGAVAGVGVLGQKREDVGRAVFG